jgi:Tfp pilus assembly PilM family ATPase
MRVSVGLDIGWKCIKVVELTSDFKIRKFGQQDIPRPITDEDENDVYVQAIIELFDSYRFSRDNVIINMREVQRQGLTL